jgi:NACalpha-BTF3-like transcription factor
MVMNISNLIDEQIHLAIKNYDNSYELGDNPFEELISMGELVDRLSIVNFKLYKLKDEVMDRQDDEKFKSWASVEDVKLVMERARLKRCIDEKLITTINRVNSGNTSGGFNPEVKKYGN